MKGETMGEQYQPELGQAAFGQPFSEFDCPEFIKAGLRMLADEIERVEWNIRQQEYEAPTSNNGESYSTDTFDMRAYYWGDCTCGWDDFEFVENHDGDCYQSELRARQEAVGYDRTSYEWDSFESNKWREMADRVYAELTSKFGLPMTGCAVHCTCSYPKRFDVWFDAHKLGPDGHEPKCPAILPNFKCGDFEVRWYKYLGRGMSMNQDIDANSFFEIIDRCLDSVRRHEDATLPDECKPF